MIPLERLKAIQASIRLSGGWRDCTTIAERLEIIEAWEAMPGESSFYDAVLKLTRDAEERAICDVSEADEAATSKRVALDNLREQVRKGETLGVVAMYERAAWAAGATVAETERVLITARIGGKR